MTKAKTLPPPDFSHTESVIWYGSLESAQAYFLQLGNLLKDWNEAQARDELFKQGEDQRFGAYSDLVTAYGDVAVIPVSGSLWNKESTLTRWFGIMTYETLSNALHAVAEDGDIKKVLLDIDSPGGLAKGVDLATDAIKAVQSKGIEVHAHASSEMLSAAYRIASPATKITAGRNAEVGSIGVIGMHVDMTKAMEEAGIKITVFRKGDEKALGTPYEPLDDKAKESIDRRMEHAYTAFIDAVAEHRGMSPEYVRNSLATGRVFSAKEAHDLKLIDSISSFSEVFDRLAPNQKPSNQTGDFAMSQKPVVTAEAPEGVLGQSAEDLAVAAAAGVNFEEGHEPAKVEVKEADPPPPASEPKEPAPAAQDSPPSLMQMVAGLNEQLVEAKVKLKAQDSELAELRSAASSLKAVVIEQTQNMRIRLGLPAGNDLDGLSASSLVTQYQETRDTFMKRFAGGPVSKVPEKDQQLPKAVVTRLDVAARRATSFGNS